MKRSKIAMAVAVSVCSAIIVFLIWKFVVVPLAAVIVGHTVETAVGLFLILILTGVTIWYLGFERLKTLREANSLLRSVLDEYGISCYSDIRGEINWGTEEDIRNWQEEDRKEMELDRYCDSLIAKIKEFKIDKHFKNEDPYKQQLRGHLAKEYPRSKVEVRTEDSRPDIEIDRDRIAIEVKGPTTTSALLTLYEKAEKYGRFYQRIVFVLFEPEYSESRYEYITKQLQEKYGDQVRFVTMKRVTDAINN